jgi:hypothetical protein
MHSRTGRIAVIAWWAWIGLHPVLEMIARLWLVAGAAGAV